MHSIESLLGMICTESIEYGGMTREQWVREGCPPIEPPGPEKKMDPIVINDPILSEEDRAYFARERAEARARLRAGYQGKYDAPEENTNSQD